MAIYRFQHLFIIFLTIISQLINATNRIPVPSLSMQPVPSLRHYAALSLCQQAQKTGKSVEAFLTAKHNPANLPNGLIPFVDTIGAISEIKKTPSINNSSAKRNECWYQATNEELLRYFTKNSSRLDRFENLIKQIKNETIADTLEILEKNGLLEKVCPIFDYNPIKPALLHNNNEALAWFLDHYYHYYYTHDTYGSRNIQSSSIKFPYIGFRKDHTYIKFYKFYREDRGYKTRLELPFLSKIYFFVQSPKAAQLIVQKLSLNELLDSFSRTILWDRLWLFSEPKKIRTKRKYPAFAALQELTKRERYTGQKLSAQKIQSISEIYSSKYSCCLIPAFYAYKYIESHKLRETIINGCQKASTITEKASTITDKIPGLVKAATLTVPPCLFLLELWDRGFDMEKIFSSSIWMANWALAIVLYKHYVNHP